MLTMYVCTCRLEETAGYHFSVSKFLHQRHKSYPSGISRYSGVADVVSFVAEDFAAESAADCTE